MVNYKTINKKLSTLFLEISIFLTLSNQKLMIVLIYN